MITVCSPVLYFWFSFLTAEERCVNKNDLLMKLSVLTHIIVASCCPGVSVWTEVFRKTTWKWCVFTFSWLSVTTVWLSTVLTLLTDRLLQRRDFKATFILLERILIQPNQRSFCFPSREEELWDEVVGLTNLKSFWTRIFIGDFLGNPVRFPSKENSFLKPGQKRWNTKKCRLIGLSVCSFTSRFLSFFFSYLQQRCQRRARPKQTDWECTTSNNTDVGGWRSTFTSQNEQTKWHGVCIVKKKKIPKERTKQT